VILSERDIDLPASAVVNRKALRGFSASYDSVIASFDPHTLLINALNPHVPVDEQGRTEVEALVEHLSQIMEHYPSPEAKTRFLIKETAFMHEVSHFHDLVCTPMGYALFTREWHILCRILIALQEAAKKGWRAQAPMVQGWDLPTLDVGEGGIFKLYTNIILNRSIFNGDIALQQGDVALCDYDIVWGNSHIADVDFRIPFYPCKISVDGEPVCLLVPLGYRSITEARAMLYQHHVMRSLGNEWVTMYSNMLASPELIHYSCINRLHAKLLRKLGFDPRSLAGPDWGEELFVLLSATLARDVGHVTGETPGIRLVEELRRIDPATGRHPGFDSQAFESMRGVVLDNRPLLFPEQGDKWHMYQLRDFVSTAIDKALQIYEEKQDFYGLKFGTLSWYSCYGATALPQPPLSAQLGRFHAPHGATGATGERALSFIVSFMTRDVIAQSIDQPDLWCPALRGDHHLLLQGLGLHEHCREGLERGGCGNLKLGGDLSSHCDCVWKKIVTGLGLADLGLQADLS
jgi:hypothetical protein